MDLSQSTLPYSPAPLSAIVCVLMHMIPLTSGALLFKETCLSKKYVSGNNLQTNCKVSEERHRKRLTGDGRRLSIAQLAELLRTEGLDYYTGLDPVISIASRKSHDQHGYFVDLRFELKKCPFDY